MLHSRKVLVFPVNRWVTTADFSAAKIKAEQRKLAILSQRQRRRKILADKLLREIGEHLFG